MSEELKPLSESTIAQFTLDATQRDSIPSNDALLLISEIWRLKDILNTRPEPRCPCGGVIYANSEDWKVPVCYQCFEEIREFFANTRHEPRCDRCKGTNGVYCSVRYSFQLIQGMSLPNSFHCKYFEEKE